MKPEKGKIKFTKRDAAIEQINAAIEQAENGKLAAAITLAAAAEGSLPATDNDHLIKRINELGLFKKLDMNAIITWLKHDTGQETAEILELEAHATIMRAISKFAATYNGVTQKMRAFLTKMEEGGYFAKEEEPEQKTAQA
jgi:hypothetical protein